MRWIIGSCKKDGQKYGEDRKSNPNSHWFLRWRCLWWCGWWYNDDGWCWWYKIWLDTLRLGLDWTTIGSNGWKVSLFFVNLFLFSLTCNSWFSIILIKAWRWNWRWTSNKFILWCCSSDPIFIIFSKFSQATNCIFIIKGTRIAQIFWTWRMTRQKE